MLPAQPAGGGQVVACGKDELPAELLHLTPAAGMIELPSD